ncbi:hypothetical protein V5P93_004514 [Actinokineospora auranticolor]|uniref:Uncharacterized protein n=1 Tax=Actinokineospora auranticolor TaxID=155976 RepID=A0A2S6GT45_9PSEU|nr:hypothetical protein [Actinokineospora auranticolor]PPK68380.1 hypothetical protein CLV40_105103 [Actinokineospora auranticolor]
MGWSEWDALGSVLGGVFSGLAFAATLFLLVREVRIRRRTDLDEQARQARPVVAAVEQESYPLAAAFRTMDLTVAVRNYSELPVFNLVVRLEEFGSGQDGFEVVRPGEQVTAELRLNRKEGVPNTFSSRTTGPTLYFMDANGRHWVRRGLGAPDRVLVDAVSAARPLTRFRPEDLQPE